MKRTWRRSCRIVGGVGAVVLAATAVFLVRSPRGRMLAAGIFDPLAPHHITLSDGYRATYYIVRKGAPGPDATVIFFAQGSERASLNYYFRAYFAALPEPAVLYALQKRHLGHRETGLFAPSAAFLRHDHLRRRIRDTREFVRRILGRHGGPRRRVVLFGVSEGADVAVAVAASVAGITHLVVVGGGGMKGLDAFRLWARPYGVDADRFHAEVLAAPDSVDRSAFGKTYRYWADALAFDPMSFYARVEVPIFAAHGERDESVPLASLRHLERAFRRIGKDNLTVKVFPGADHRLMGPGGEDHRPTLMRLVASWWSTSPAGDD